MKNQHLTALKMAGVAMILVVFAIPSKSDELTDNFSVSDSCYKSSGSARSGNLKGYGTIVDENYMPVAVGVGTDYWVAEMAVTVKAKCGGHFIAARRFVDVHCTRGDRVFFNGKMTFIMFSPWDYLLGRVTCS